MGRRVALTWLANEVSRRGDSLRAGELVAAGTCTGLHFISAGGTVEADFGAALGTVKNSPHRVMASLDPRGIAEARMGCR